MANPAFPDLAIPLRTAIIGNSAIMGNMPDYANGDAVFTRRPVPTDAPSPMIVIGPDIGDTDLGGLSDQRLKIIRDIAIYGANVDAVQYRATELVAYAVRNLFHRSPTAIKVTGWKVVNIWARGPMQLHVDTPDKDVARNVELTVELSAAIT